ncbi:MAG: hypothetical protein C0498_09255 [Anaerolinea sp.]|nr:hypothetical protein [Anaerolinea sp.]
MKESGRQGRPAPGGFQLHVLGIVFLPSILALAVRAIARRAGPSAQVDAAARALVALGLGALILLDIRLSPRPIPTTGGRPAATRGPASLLRLKASAFC